MAPGFPPASMSRETSSRLEEQDRSRWSRSMIQRGMVHLRVSAQGNEVSEYHLQAAIAALHCMAPDYESTDWRQILSLYDRLTELNDSPVIALNPRGGRRKSAWSRKGNRSGRSHPRPPSIGFLPSFPCGSRRVRGATEPVRNCCRPPLQSAPAHRSDIRAILSREETPGVRGASVMKSR